MLIIREDFSGECITCCVCWRPSKCAMALWTASAALRQTGAWAGGAAGAMPQMHGHVSVCFSMHSSTLSVLYTCIYVLYIGLHTNLEGYVYQHIWCCLCQVGAPEHGVLPVLLLWAERAAAHYLMVGYGHCCPAVDNLKVQYARTRHSLPPMSDCLQLDMRKGAFAATRCPAPDLIAAAVRRLLQALLPEV